MPNNKSIRHGLMPLAWAAILCLLIAAALILTHQAEAPIPADAVYVLAEPENAICEARV